MGLVTVFGPLTTTDALETGFQTAAEPRLRVDCKVSPAVLLVGHVRTTFVPERVIVSCAVAEPTSIKPRLVNTAGRTWLGVGATPRRVSRVLMRVFID